jgi:hypothetical protein
MAAKSFDIEKFIQGMVPNITKKYGISSKTTRQNKTKAGVAQGIANRKRAAAKKAGAEGPKRSVAKKKTPKITKVPSKHSAFKTNTKISLPKSGTRVVSTNPGRNVRITKKNSSGRTEMIGSGLSYTSVAKRGNVRHKNPKKSTVKYGKR